MKCVADLSHADTEVPSQCGLSEGCATKTVADSVAERDTPHNGLHVKSS